MNYTFLSAVFANIDHTSAVALTQEAGAVAVSQSDMPDLWGLMLQAVDPAAYTPPPPPRVISALEFMERLSLEQRQTIRAAAQQSPELEDWLDLLRAAQVVELDDPRTSGGVAAMQAAGLLSEADAEALLA